MNADQVATKHTCNEAKPGMPLPFGRKAPTGACPRCDELRDGAAPRELAWADSLDRAAANNRSRDTDRRAHFAADGPHQRGTCGPVCTFGDW